MVWTVGTLFFGLVLILASIPLVFKPAQRTPSVATLDTSGITVNVSASLADDRTLTVFIRLPVDRADIIDPRVQIVMTGHQMTVPANVLSAGPGAYQASAMLPMAGQWEVQVGIGDEIVRLPVDANPAGL
ncbi:YtkA-like [Pelagibacterium halotolerans]|uniref:YtkA-like domain-containing protein n=2 Tax=Pelagibacterium TaxID=1082930 RepID=G4RDU9_PELHB|nr:hypothetical protein KKY_3879 [Pelagibacterium halotolerans B2]SEA45221.1 YtkA-like [Pelagibacterium halotolerans]